MDGELTEHPYRLSASADEVAPSKNRSTERHRLCAFDELIEGAPTRFVVDDRPVAVVRIADDVYAIDDRCTHQDVPLSGGEVDPDQVSIECPRHGSRFSLATGRALGLPATKPAFVYPVEVVGSDVYVEVES